MSNSPFMILFSTGFYCFFYDDFWMVWRLFHAEVKRLFEWLFKWLFEVAFIPFSARRDPVQKK
jgi:ABC-type multidrug transport system permease subunit